MQHVENVLITVKEIQNAYRSFGSKFSGIREKQCAKNIRSPKHIILLYHRIFETPQVCYIGEICDVCILFNFLCNNVKNYMDGYD